MRTPRSARLSASAAGCALGAPIENINEPPTGCPSAEITRQLSRCVPRCKFAGAVTVTVLFSPTTERGAIDAPSGPMRRITSGETGSLNVKLSAGGATGTTAPSAGDALTSEACAHASPACASAINNPMKPATTLLPRLVMPAGYIFGSSFKAGAGSGYSLAGLPAAGISIQR